MSNGLKNQLIQRAGEAFQRRAFGEAADICGQVLSQFGEEANALMMLGAMRMDADDVAGAIDLYERARAAMPTHIHVLVNLGSAYRAAGRLHEARIVLEEALAVDRRFAVAHNNLGNVLLDLGDRAGAKREYERAVVGQANYAEPVAALARIAEEEHRLDDARRLSDRALSLAAGNASASLTRARVASRTGDAAKAAGDLEDLLRREGLSPTNRIVAEGYLGEAYDRLGRFSDAFAAFARANAHLYAQHAPSFAADRGPVSLGTIQRLNAFVGATDVSAWRAAEAGPETTPVFLVGFPRSGTTLLEQVLASHPEITTLEERDTLTEAADTLIGSGERLERWAGLSGGEIERLRSSYWRQARAALGAAPMKRVFVDKLPLNAAFLPLIHRLFPASRVVLAVRDPRDIVLSCFQQRFVMNAAMFQLLRLDTAAAYYDAVMALVRTCRARLPLSIHEVRYEAVVDDFDATVRGLLAFLGVAWDDRVRDFAETAKTRAIGTPSATQVVQPLYATARGKWRNYRAFLEPVLPVLEPWVEAFGYEPS